MRRSLVRVRTDLPPLLNWRETAVPRVLEAAETIGGNISGGSTDLRQLFLRPTRRTYSTLTKGLYICSSSTPPGGVHGMCGFYAARKVLKER